MFIIKKIKTLMSNEDRFYLLKIKMIQVIQSIVNPFSYEKWGGAKLYAQSLQSSWKKTYFNRAKCEYFGWGQNRGNPAMGK